MVSVRTERLRKQAELLSREARRYDYKFPVLEDSISWLRQQEFDEKNEIQRVLTRQNEELREQKRELVVLAEAMRRICDKYEKAEQRIMDSGEMPQKTNGRVEWVELEHIKVKLSGLGISLKG